MQVKTGGLRGVEDICRHLGQPNNPSLFMVKLAKADFSDRCQKRRAMAFLEAQSSLRVNMREIYLILPVFLL